MSVSNVHDFASDCSSDRMAEGLQIHNLYHKLSDVDSDII